MVVRPPTNDKGAATHLLSINTPNSETHTLRMCRAFWCEGVELITLAALRFEIILVKKLLFTLVSQPDQCTEPLLLASLYRLPLK